MDDELSESEMTGSVTCLSKETISGLYKCFLSCLVLVALIYIILILLAAITSIEIATLYKTLGFISLIVILSAPIGFYGCCRHSYCALFAYLLIGSYHLYALVIYIWFNLTAKAFDNLILHQTTTGAYAVLIILTLLICGARIVSISDQGEKAKIIVVDNNPSE